MTALCVIQRLNTKRISPVKAGVLLHLAKGPATSDDIQTGAGLTQSTVSIAIKALRTAGAIEKVEDRPWLDLMGRQRLLSVYSLTSDGEQEVRGILK